MRLLHVNLVARDAQALSKFYISALKCVPLREPVRLTGSKVAKGNGVPNSEIYSIWLAFPGNNSPFLEIHQHSVTLGRDLPQVNEPGFGHLAFEVADINVALAEITAAGGTQIGETTDFGNDARPLPIAYVRDPEGNILELEQRR